MKDFQHMGRELLHGKMDCICAVRGRCQIVGDVARKCIQKWDRLRAFSNAEKGFGIQMAWTGSSWEGTAQKRKLAVVW